MTSSSRCAHKTSDERRSFDARCGAAVQVEAPRLTPLLEAVFCAAASHRSSSATAAALQDLCIATRAKQRRLWAQDEHISRAFSV
mmetsp:Transcript_420/g.1565  ORF Transcript_420/g.1565 Transcript_420/m.1565 type:complete len:85 (+) Transcript_420:2678-2932(+)